VGVGDPLEWYNEIPVVSRLYLTGSFLTTAACALDLVSPFSLYFNFKLIFYKGQVGSICELCDCQVLVVIASRNAGVASPDELSIFWDLQPRLPLPHVFLVSCSCLDVILVSR
jgi:hypothetical protein